MNTPVSPAVSVVCRDDLMHDLLLSAVTVVTATAMAVAKSIECWFRRWFDGDGHGGSFSNGYGKGSGSYHERRIVLADRGLLEGGVDGVVTGLGGGGFLTIFFFGCLEMRFEGYYGAVCVDLGSSFSVGNGE